MKYQFTHPKTGKRSSVVLNRKLVEAYLMALMVRDQAGYDSKCISRGVCELGAQVQEWARQFYSPSKGLGMQLANTVTGHCEMCMYAAIQSALRDIGLGEHARYPGGGGSQG